MILNKEKEKNSSSAENFRISRGSFRNSTSTASDVTEETAATEQKQDNMRIECISASSESIQGEVRINPVERKDRMRIVAPESIHDERREYEVGQSLNQSSGC